MIRRHPFLIFNAIIGVLVALTIWFIQSPRFARAFKTAAARYLPADLGVEADFSEFAVKLFPPGISLRNPVISLRERNVLQMPPGTSVKARRIDLVFQPFQMLSGDIRVHEVAIIDGEANVILAKKPPARQARKKLSLDFHWDELLQIRAEAVALENTRLNLTWQDTKETLGFHARSLRLGQWSGKGGLGYELSADLGQISGTMIREIPFAGSLESVSALARSNVLGVQLERLAVKAPGFEAVAQGGVKGDILHPKELALDAQLSASGDLARIAGHLAEDGTRPLRMTGEAEFKGRVGGNLLSPMESLRVQGTFSAKNAAFQEWRADRAEIEGSWSASADGGQVSVSRGLLQAAERERGLGGEGARGGSGGRLEIGAFKLDLGSRAPFTVPLRAERAHIHWLAAIALKDVYALQFRVTGPIAATVALGKAWSISSKLDLSVQDFQLDNQKLTLRRPLHRVLKIPEIKLAGDVIVDSLAVKPMGLSVAMQRSKFKLDGKVNFKTGYDLTGVGEAHLEELGEVAENPIRGDGPLTVRVQGPGSAVQVHFDAELENAAYLNMDFGSLKGRITWDDDHNHLILSKLALKQGVTSYSGDGMLDLGDAESIALHVKVASGDVQDMIRIFGHLTRDLWWFPRSLSGEVSGEIQVFGGISMKRLEVLARMSGEGWQYLGERFDKVSIVGGYERGRYHLSDFRATKHAGRIHGHLSFDADERFDWELHSQQFTFSDLDRVAQLDVPIRGKLSLDSVGKGKAGEIRSNTQVLVNEVSVRGVALPPSQLLVRSESGRTELKGAALGGQGTLDMSYDFSAENPSYIRAEMKHLDFSPALLLLNPKLIPDPAVSGYVSGALNLSFRAGQVDRATGSVEIGEYLLAKTGARFALAHPVSFRVNDGSFDLRDLSLVGSNGLATLILRSRKAELEGTVSGNLDVSIAEFATSSIQQANGLASLDFTIGGMIKEPTLLGRATLEGAFFRVPAVESPFENVTGSLHVRQNVLEVRNLEAELAGGRAIADGTITVYADRYPELALKGTLTGNRVKVFPFQFVKVRGNLGVSGDSVPYLVDGALIIDSALSKEKVFQQKQVQGLKAALYTPPPTSRRQGDYPLFRLNIDAKAENGILVQNDLFDVELKAKVTVVNTIETPRIVGDAEVLHGRMIFKDKSFQIQSASAIFDNPTILNPRFSLTGLTEVSNVKIQLFAAGRLDRWKVELSSNPVMPESEIISLLALGLSPSDTKKLSSSDRTLFEQGEAASLILNSLDFNREVESKTGFQIQLDESVNAQQGSSIFRPQTGAEAAASPKIVIRKQITKNVDVSYGSTVGVGTSNQKEVNAEVQVTPGFSVIGVWDNYESSDAKDKQTSYGLDFKLQKRFK